MIGKVLLLVLGINLFLSAMIMVAVPYLVTEVLDLEASRANRLYGFAEGALAAGGLAGGICAGIFADRLQIRRAGSLVIACAAGAFPIAAALLFDSSGVVSYMILTACCFAIMVCSTIFTVQMLSFTQRETPQNLMGKVMAVILTVAMCAQPLGNILYGALFEILKGAEYAVVLFSGLTSLLLALKAEKIFRAFPEG